MVKIKYSLQKLILILKLFSTYGKVWMQTRKQETTFLKHSSNMLSISESNFMCMYFAKVSVIPISLYWTIILRTN